MSFNDTKDVKEIIEQAKRFKKDKHFLDTKPAQVNTVGGTPKRVPGKSADASLKLPTVEEQAKKADELGKMFDKTSRSGAKAKPGTHGIRPHGGKAATKFLEDFVGTGRFKKQEEPERTFFKDDKVRDVKKPRVVIFKHCMDCMKQVTIEEGVPSMTFVPPPQHINAIARAKWQSVRVNPGDVVCYIFHKACMDAAAFQMKVLGRGIITYENGQQVTAAQRYARERGNRISDQVHQYLVSECLRGESEVYYNPDGSPCPNP
jgi:hypothetical protein